MVHQTAVGATRVCLGVVPITVVMSVIVHIAKHVFRDAVREKVLYYVAVFAAGLIAASYLIGQLTAGQDIKIVKDLALSATSLFGLFIAVFVGIGVVARDVERRSIYIVLSKPVRRSELILGKYLGLVLTLAVNVIAMAIAMYGVLAYLTWTESEEFLRGLETPPTDPALLKALWLIFVELTLIAAVALCLSTFAGPIVSAALTFGLYVVGHFNADLRDFHHTLDSPAAVAVARVLYFLLPNLAPFDVKGAVVHGQLVPFEYLAWTSAYAVLYISALLVMALLIFARRDFT